MANLYELATVTEIFQVTDVYYIQNKPSGVRIGLGPVGSSESHSDTYDSRFKRGDIELGDIVKVDFSGPSVGQITEIFREGLQVFPPRNPEQTRWISKNVAFRKTTRTAVATAQ